MPQEPNEPEGPPVEGGGETTDFAPIDLPPIGDDEPGAETHAETLVSDGGETGGEAGGQTTVATGAAGESAAAAGAETAAETMVTTAAPPIASARAAAPVPVEGPLVFDWRRQEAFVALGSDEYQNLRLSRLALASFVFGLTAATGPLLFALDPTGDVIAWFLSIVRSRTDVVRGIPPGPGIYMMVGITAVFLGALAVDGIRKHGNVLTGRLIAYAGIALGLVSTLTTVVFALLNKELWLVM